MDTARPESIGEQSEGVLASPQYKEGDGSYFFVYDGLEFCLVLNDKPDGIRFSLPGGSVEKQESLLGAGCRETQIETGIPEHRLLRDIRPLHRDGTPFHTTSRGRKLFAHIVHLPRKHWPEKLEAQEEDIVGVGFFHFNPHRPLAKGFMWEGTWYNIRPSHVQAICEAFKQIEERHALVNEDEEKSEARWDGKNVPKTEIRQRGWSPSKKRADRRQAKRIGKKLG